MLTAGSLSVHGALTEDVCKNVSGKGREGNKEGKGCRGETPHHVVTYVERAARDSMMTGDRS